MGPWTEHLTNTKGSLVVFCFPLKVFPPLCFSGSFPFQCVYYDSHQAGLTRGAHTQDSSLPREVKPSEGRRVTFLVFLSSQPCFLSITLGLCGDQRLPPWEFLKQLQRTLCFAVSLKEKSQEGKTMGRFNCIFENSEESNRLLFSRKSFSRPNFKNKDGQKKKKVGRPIGNLFRKSV